MHIDDFHDFRILNKWEQGLLSLTYNIFHILLKLKLKIESVKNTLK